MKTPLILIVLVILTGCTNKNERKEILESADYFKNLFTGETLPKSEFEKFRDSLIVLSTNFKNTDTLKREMELTIHFKGMFSSNDSVIQTFKYSIRVGQEYIVRENSYEKIGLKIPQRTFLSLNGDSVQIGGKQAKPMLINLWFVSCPGCVQELPTLNKLQEKYANKMNFIAMTFEDRAKVEGFFKKKKTEFNYKHIVNTEDYIKQIGTQPYPENIFINKEGYITNIEGGIPDGERLKYVESIIEKLL